MTGIVDGLPIGDYVKDPASPGPSLSASSAHTLLTRSPLHCWTGHPRLNPAWEPDEFDMKQIVGTVTHALLLENDRSRVVVIEADDFKTKAAQVTRNEALAAGKLPILAARMADVEAVVEIARVRLDASEMPYAFHGGHAERTLVWTDERGVTWRSRPDWMSADHRVLLDLKTTGGSAEPDAWARGPLLAHGADLQAVLALRGMDALYGPAARTFVFVVLETTPPYGLSLVALDPQFMEFAAAKLDRAATVWRACLESGAWPAYPSRICWASPPEYLVYRWGERAALDSGEGAVADL